MVKKEKLLEKYLNNTNIKKIIFVKNRLNEYFNLMKKNF